MNSYVSIYALLDPRDQRARYIGQTTKTLPKRLSAHLSEARRERARSYRVRWIQSLLSHGVEPSIRELCRVEPTMADSTEIRLIASYKKTGHRLVNGTPGGDGIKAEGYPDELRCRLAAINTGKRHSPETIAKMSRTRTGRNRSPEAVLQTVATRRQNGSYKMTEEHRQRVAEGVRKLWCDPEYRARVSSNVAAASKRAWEKRRLNEAA
jgi:hypothetical protein